MIEHIGRWTFLALRCVALISIGAGLIATPPVAAGEPAADGPLDLAALILHSDDLNGLLEDMDLLFEYPYGMALGASFTSVEEAVAHEGYAIGRGGFTLGRMDETDATAIFAETGWIRAQNEFLVLPELRAEEDTDQWSLGVGVTIEEFATADGARAALTAFDDEEVLAQVATATRAERLDLPAGFEDESAVIWEMDTARYAENGITETVTMWVQVDTLVVSVALLHAPGYIAPEADHLVPLVELQLERIRLAEYLHQPRLSICAPQLGGEQVADQLNDYLVLNGQTFADQNMTFDELDEDQVRFHEQGIVDSFRVSQSIGDTAVGAYDGEMWFQGRSLSFVDEEHAETYLATTADRLEESDYTGIEAMTDVPDLGDAAVGYTYVGADDYPATIVLVQSGAQVFSIRLGSTTEPVPGAVFTLAGQQVERMTGDDCLDAMPVPRDLS
jgi:hypothetical protein